MKVVLKNGITTEVAGARIKEVAVSVSDDILAIVLIDGDVILAKSIHANG